MPRAQHVVGEDHDSMRPVPVCVLSPPIEFAPLQRSLIEVVGAVHVAGGGPLDRPALDGRETIPTLAEVIALAKARGVGIYPETKHPTYHAALGLALLVSVPLGLAAAATRGSLLDELIMRGNDLIFAFPSLVNAILITAALGPSARLIHL